MTAPDTTSAPSPTSTATLGGMLLASHDPERLREWYVAALGVTATRTPDDAQTTAERIEHAGTSWVAALEDRDGSWFATGTDPDGNYVQIISLSDEAMAAMR
jgi:predicted enzyme related to lactoylglutathione lyase